ncbi:hypothetical protein I317_05913 [Kwoniella heveanensis CBS 569]|nr:hypothetical protein I317_05913 [Kwoniella heveanensis CBS 569]
MNATASPLAASGSSGGAPDVNTVMWAQMGAMMTMTTWYATLGTVLQALIVSSILSNSVRYFEYFTRTDSIWLLEAVGVGALMTVGALALTCAQAYKLVYMDETNIASHFRFLMLADMSHLLVGAIFNAAAGVYYAYRAYRMSKGRWWVIPPFALGLTAQFIVALVAVVNGLKMPALTPAAVRNLPQFMAGTIKWFRAWGAITVAVDGSLCLFMTYMLFKSKQGIFHNQNKLFHRLLSIIYETMLPPVICLLILEATTSIKGSPLTDFRRIFTSILPVLYYHSTLQTLVGRQSIRSILDNKLAADGIEHYSGSGSNHAISGAGRATRSGGRVYISRPKEVEKDGVEMDVKTPNSGGPFIRIETERQVSGPDSLSPVHMVPSLNRSQPSSTGLSQASPSWDDHELDPSQGSHLPKWGSTDRLYPTDSGKSV